MPIIIITTTTGGTRPESAHQKVGGSNPFGRAHVTISAKPPESSSPC